MSAKLSEYKVEEALQLLMQANAGIASLITADAALEKESPFNVYTGIDANAIDFSCITLEATDAEPMIGQGPFLGNWLVTVSIKLYTNFKEPAKGKAEHYARLELIQAVIMDDALQTSLNALVADLVTGEPMMKGRRTSVQDECWVHETIIAIPARDGA